MKSIIAALIAIFAVSTSQATLKAMSDQDMRQIYAGNALATNIYATLSEILAEGKEIHTRDLIAIFEVIGSETGVVLEGIEVEGEQYGAFPVTISGPGQVEMVGQLPSKVERAHIAAIRIGDGPSMGSLTIENINLVGSLKVQVRP